MTMALGIITGTSVPLYVNKVTKYSQERDGCHYLSILGIAVAQASCVVRVWKISNKFSISRITHLVGYCSQSVTSGCKPQPPGAGQVGGWARQERQVERSRTTSPDHRCWGERISNNNACRKHFENKVLNEWVCSVGSSDEPVHDGLLSRSPSYHPVERNANQRRTRKAADAERAVAREPASRHLHLQETQRQAETWGSFRMEKG